MSYPPGYCVCGEPACPHDCKGDDNSPAVQMLVDAMFAVHACAQCGTEDETVARGGTALCSACQELSVHQARDEGGRLARLARRWRVLRIAPVAIWIIAVAIWIIGTVAIVLWA